ncbi:hypothetical protein PTMSG1_04079 [Pyrenophora teres f. maculata]|nr:hypothetical protein PTMSG1_04079 [Pyrenophora teres f. maculata]
MLDLSDQASLPSTSDGPIPGSRGAGRKDDGIISLALPPTDLHNVGDGDSAYAQGAVEELLQARGSIPPSEGLEFEQDVGWESDRRVMNREGSGSKVGEIFEEELSHNESCNTPPSRSQRLRSRARAPKTGRELSNTTLRPLDYNTVPTRAPQQVRSSRPQQNSMPGQPNVDKRPQSCSPRSHSPGTTARDRTNINYEHSLGMSCQITNFTLCTIPNGSSIVTAIVRHCDLNGFLDPVAQGHKVLGEQGKVIRITQLSPGSWMLLGYRCNDSTLDLCNRGGLNKEWMSSSHNNAASHGTDHSDDN